MSKFEAYLKNNRKSVGTVKAGDDNLYNYMDIEVRSEQNGIKFASDATNTSKCDADF